MITVRKAGLSDDKELHCAGEFSDLFYNSFLLGNFDVSERRRHKGYDTGRLLCGNQLCEKRIHPVWQ